MNVDPEALEAFKKVPALVAVPQALLLPWSLKAWGGQGHPELSRVGPEQG